MTHTGRVARFAAVALTLTASACSDDDKSDASSASSASASTTSTTSSSTTTTTTVPGGSCDASPVSTSATRLTAAQADFNGDGTVDTLSVYGEGTDDQPAPYHVHIALGIGAGAVDQVIPDAATDSNSVVRALGGADITASAGLPPDGSGDEAFVTIGSGASASIVGVYQLVNCVLTRVNNPQGQPSSFAIGGSVTHLDGLKCDGTAGGQRLVQMSATSNDGVTYATTENRLEVQNGQFAVTNTVNDSIDVNDDRLQTFSGLDCAGVITP